MKSEFESELLQRAVEDRSFRAALLANPKRVLERELSRYVGRRLTLPKGTVVRAMASDPDTVYLVLPEAKGNRRRRKLPIIKTLLKIAGAKSVYGLFMGYLDDVWVRVGLFRGTPLSDVLDEIKVTPRKN